MELKKIKEQIKITGKPVIHIIQKSENFKVIAIGLDKGVALKKHKAPGRAKLLILEGRVNYISQRESAFLEQYDEYDIPLEEFHEVMALEASVFLLIVG